MTKAAQVDASISDVKIDFGNESPPDYEIALAMCRAERQTNSDYFPNQVRINTFKKYCNKLDIMKL